MKAVIVATILGAALMCPVPAEAWNPFSKLKEKISGSQQADQKLSEEAPKILEGKPMEESIAEPGDEADKNMIPVNSPEYEWSQFDSKVGKALLTESGLQVESKVNGGAVLSTVELDFDPASDFTFGLLMTAKPEDNKYVGVVFDYQNNRNYKVLSVSKKQFVYYTVDNGAMAVVKQGLVKTGKLIVDIKLAKKGDKIGVTLNGIEAATLKNIKLSSPNCGIIVEGKYKVMLSNFYFKQELPDTGTEQSTSEI